MQAGTAGDPWASRANWIDLWPGAAPGTLPVPPVEAIKARPATDAPPILEITGVSRPRLLVLRPPRPNGSAALVMPGGGYARLVVAQDGPEIGRWLAARGWTVFVLLYRLPGDGWADRANVPLQDAQRAIRLVRRQAGAFGINPKRVAAIGFSAGGHLCADLATRSAALTYAPIDAADALSARPDFTAPVYAVQSLADPYAHRGSRERLLGPNPSSALIQAHSPENNVAPGTPPFLIIHAEDDPTVSVENSLRMRSALKAANVRVETHLFPDGGHGFGINRVAETTTSVWPELLVRAAKSYGLG
jgi:acetyl esterase/lipase